MIVNALKKIAMDMGKAHCSMFAIDFVAFGNADKLLVRQVVEDLLQNAASQACVKAEAALRWRLESFFSEGGGWIMMDSDGYGRIADRIWDSRFDSGDSEWWTVEETDVVKICDLM